MLGFEPPVYGGFPDGGLAAVDPDLLIGTIVEQLRRWRPSIVITFGPEGAPNAHRDHRAISRAATAAFFAARIATLFPDQIGRGLDPHAPSRLFYVAWPDPPADAELPARSLPVTASIDIAAFRETKRRSFFEHVTQRDHLQRFETLGLTSHEGFHLAAGAPQPRPLIDDLFEGLESRRG
jgi:LmbE family N-acetylglucosaminyl deacetylase